MSRGAKRQVKHLKEQRNFEKNPPRCFNCIFFKKEVHGVPGVKQYSPPYCKDGGFVVLEVSICDSWKGKDGSVLC